MNSITRSRIGKLNTRYERKCPICGTDLRLTQMMRERDGGPIVCVFECKCGTRVCDEGATEDEDAN